MLQHCAAYKALCLHKGKSLYNWQTIALGWDGIDSPRTLDKSSRNFANFLAQEAIDWRADRCLKTLK